MLGKGRRTNLVAASSVFAALYAVLGLVPVSPYLAGPAYLPLNKILLPLMGILLGPVAGSLAVVIGTFADYSYTHAARLPLGVVPLDFVPDVIVLTVVWLAYTNRRGASLGLPVVLLLLFFADPLSVTFVQVGPVAVPFAWLHILSVFGLALGLLLRQRGSFMATGPVFLSLVALAAFMAGQLAGTIIGQNLFVRFGTLAQSAWVGFVSNWPSGARPLPGFFYTYPLERIFYTFAAVIVAVPTLRYVVRKPVVTKL